MRVHGTRAARAALATGVAALLALGGCAGGGTDGGGAAQAPDAGSGDGGGSGDGSGGSGGGGSSGQVDLAGVDACSLLSIAEAQALVSEDSINDADDFGAHPEEPTCFWNGRTSAYVEVHIYGSGGSFPGARSHNGAECTPTPSDALDVPTQGWTCPGSVFLQAFDRGVMIDLAVNQPRAPLTPDDLAPTMQDILDQL